MMPSKAAQDQLGTRFPKAFAAIIIVLAMVLQVMAIREQSLTGDGSVFLAAGHQALRYGQNTLNLEHPPLLSMVAAVPSLFEEPLLGPVRARDWSWATNELYADPDRLLRLTRSARTMLLVLFVMPYFISCYMLGARFGSRRTGLLLFAMVALSFDVLPNLTILQTDAPASLAYALVALACMKYMDRPSVFNAVLLGGLIGMALVSKFSCLLLGPAVFFAMVVAGKSMSRWRRVCLHGLIAIVFASGIIISTYAIANRNYDHDVGIDSIQAYARGEATVRATPASAEQAARVLLAMEEWEPRLAQWVAGVNAIRANDAVGPYASYAFGSISSVGRWWYFPVVFLVKTPVVILAAALLAWFLTLRQKKCHRPSPIRRRDAWIVAIIVVVYVVMAMKSNYNIGIRHLMPITVFLYLPIAVVCSTRRVFLVGMVCALALESFLLAPLWMSATNTWWLGKVNPTRLALSGNNMEHRQNFMQLGKYAKRHEIKNLNVLFPLLSSNVLPCYIPDVNIVWPESEIGPGWYAVSVMVEQFLPSILEAAPQDLYNYEKRRQLALHWKPVWDQIREGEDRGIIAGSFRLYYIPGE